jgi:tripartite-type tricarboxylate transporter receptor subunit TctC
MQLKHAVRALALASVSLTLDVLSLSGFAFGQDYPNRTIQIVAGFPAGGSADTVARVVGEAMSKEFGQPIIVENRVGATGTIAANMVATKEADGYTLLLVPGGHALYGATFKALPFDPVGSFEWISIITKIPFLFSTSAKTEFKSMADLVAKAKVDPGAIKFGSVGPGSTHHLSVELLSLATGAKFLHVPYRGEAPMITALLTSEIDFAASTPHQVIGNVQSGTLRALAVSTNARSSGLPDVPTMQQALNLKDFDVATWFALAGPANLPAPIVEKLNATLRKVLQIPEVKTRLASIGGDVEPSSPKEMRDRVRRELEMWTKIVDAAGVPKQ